MSKRNNIQVYLREKNLGYGSSVNYAVKKVKTNYFLAVQCDVEGINKKSLETFLLCQTSKRQVLYDGAKIYRRSC